MIKMIQEVKDAGDKWQPKAAEVPAVLVTKDTVEEFIAEAPRGDPVIAGSDRPCMILHDVAVQSSGHRALVGAAASPLLLAEDAISKSYGGARALSAAFRWRYRAGRGARAGRRQRRRQIDADQAARRLDHPDEGEILVDGVAVIDTPHRATSSA